MRDFRIPPISKWGLRCTGHCAALVYNWRRLGTDTLSRNVGNNKCCAISQKTEDLKNISSWLFGDRQNVMTENMTFSFTSNGGKRKEVVVWYELQFRRLSEGTGVCPWVYEDRLYADQDFKQGSPNTKQEYYLFGRSLLFRSIVRRFRNKKKNCTSAVTLY